MTPNPPINGHRLLHEGHFVRKFDATGEQYADRLSGGCECGARPERDAGGWLPSIRGTKRWHREHKAELRAQRDSSAHRTPPASAQPSRITRGSL